jgi:hypothetical protein
MTHYQWNKAGTTVAFEHDEFLTELLASPGYENIAYTYQVDSDIGVEKQITRIFKSNGV